MGAALGGSHHTCHNSNGSSEDPPTPTLTVPGRTGGIREHRANALPAFGSDERVPGPLAQVPCTGCQWQAVEGVAHARVCVLGGRGSGISILTLHPVPTHWAEEVGVEAEGLVNLPEDLSDVPDLPRNGYQTHLHFLEGASDFQPMSRGSLFGSTQETAPGRQEGELCDQRQAPARRWQDGAHRTWPSWGLSTASALTLCLGLCQAPTPPSLHPFLTVHRFGGWAFSAVGGFT